MKNLLKTALLLAALYVAWLGLTQTDIVSDIVSDDIRFRGHSEYGALLGGRR